MSALRRHSAKRRILLVLIVFGLILLAVSGMVIRPLGRTQARFVNVRVSPKRA